jgi:hypothetical protein
VPDLGPIFIGIQGLLVGLGLHVSVGVLEVIAAGLAAVLLYNVVKWGRQRRRLRGAIRQGAGGQEDLAGRG